MRAIERSRHADLGELLKGRMDGCMTLSGGMGMRYCPWCGVTLGKFYAAHWQELIDESITDEFGPGV
jgi:hypothetical protein